MSSRARRTGIKAVSLEGGLLGLRGGYRTMLLLEPKAQNVQK